MSRLLIVSNRLPVTVKLERGKVVISSSSGGLATGLRGPHEQSDSLWIGWPGDISRFDARQRAHVEKELSSLRTSPVHLSQAEISRYYDGFSSGVLWPLFHYQTDKVERNAWRNWKTYVEVNERFGRLVAENYRRGDLVWVHDYQLALVPGLLRRLIPSARIGFFLHIPFPSSEVFRILPWRVELLRGLLGADLIGFHTYSYVTHFRRAVRHVLDVDTDGELIRYDGREVQLGVFPMGIDAGGFARLAEDAGVVTEAAAIKSKTGERKLLLGVDRLDYTKGLPRRMLAVERLLEREPALGRKIRMVQVAVPSRTQVDAYNVLTKQLHEMVGRINGSYGTINAVPIHYIYRSLSERELVALYRAADIMLVTPLRDGMNLVAKEFVACRTDVDGVLILSEFAGAAAELAEAVLVNPYDIDRVASAIKRALVMEEGERRARMGALRRRVQAYDSYRWANTFIEALGSAREVARPLSASPAEEMADLLRELRAAFELMLLLDYDGTLVPFASTPELAAPDPELKQLLRALAARPRTTVHVISGRTRETLEQWLGRLPIGLHAEHAFWSRPSPAGPWLRACEEPAEWKERILPLLEQFTTATPGSLLEDKTAGIAWHYRGADPDFGELHAKELRVRLEKELNGLPVEVLPGKKVLEVRLQGVNKASVVPGLVSGEQGQPVVLAMGDDETDEDLFGALPSSGFAVHVGPGPSRARYRLDDPAAARSFLRGLLR